MNNQLLFVCGFPSGGTDLLKTILNAHPLIYLNGEMPLLHKIADLNVHEGKIIDSEAEIDRIKDNLLKFDIWHNIENLEEDIGLVFQEYGNIRFDSLLKVLFTKKDVIVWGNKTPQNSENMQILHKLFPQAKFLIIVRDIRDVCISWQKKWGKDMLWCADKWSYRMQKAWEAAQVIADNQTLFIAYESLITQTQANCEAICDFLNIPFSDQMLAHYQFIEERLDGKINYGQKIIPQNFNKWVTQLTSDQICRIEQIAYETMNSFGYTVSIAQECKPITKLEKGRGVLNDLLGTIATGNKASHHNSVSNRLKNALDDLYKWRAR